MLVLIMVCLVCSSVRSFPFTTNDKNSDPKILDIVTQRGYPFEIHHVTTSDGYILSIYRIPHGKSTKIMSKKPLLLQHALFMSPDQFLIPDVTHGLGYVLADNGYDVWLGNWRGTQYSRNHTSLHPDKDRKFWHFSWHEMGIFDLPAMIDYILNVTSQAKLHYVGHSQGNTAFYVLATTRPEYNSKIKAQISLAPPVYMTHIPDPVTRCLAFLLKHVTKFLETLETTECFSSQKFTTKVLKALCNLNDRICADILTVIFRVDPTKFSTDMATFLRFFPAGASIRQVLHYAQGVNSKCFHWYDYGEKNLEVYGTVRPRTYNLSLVTAPIYLLYSRKDNYVGEIDVFRLCRKIGGACLGKFLIADDDFTHLDFTFGIRAPELLYPKMLHFLQKL